MDKLICPTCTIVGQNGIFYPKHGRPFNEKEWNTKCCRYVKANKKPCLNPCDEVIIEMLSPIK